MTRPHTCATICLEASKKRGFGHLMRSIELASALKQYGNIECDLLFTDMDEKAFDIIRATGIPFSRLEPSSSETVEMRTMTRLLSVECEIIIFDIPPEREMKKGWKKLLPLGLKTVVIDSLAEWVAESDLVVIPSLIVEETVNDTHFKKTKILYGKDYLIIRKDIRDMKPATRRKDLDVLVYLHHEDVIKKTEDILKKSPYSYLVIRGFRQDFYSLMARAKAFVSGFGISFYEAVYLGAYPLAIPHSSRHEIEATAFFKAMALKDGILRPDNEYHFLETLGYALEYTTSRSLPRLQDGTGNIVNAIRQLTT